MSLQKKLLVGSASVTAILCAAAPTMAADAASDSSSASTVSEVVVTGIRASLERAVAIKRNASDQVEAISSEDIGKLPDKNVADALTRIPGMNTSRPPAAKAASTRTTGSVSAAPRPA